MTDKSQKERRREELEDISWLMSHAQGRRFMWRLLSSAGVFHSSFTGDETTYFKEGCRAVGLKFFADVQEEAPEMYVTMQREANENG